MKGEWRMRESCKWSVSSVVDFSVKVLGKGWGEPGRFGSVVGEL